MGKIEGPGFEFSFPTTEKFLNGCLVVCKAKIWSDENLYEVSRNIDSICTSEKLIIDMNHGQCLWEKIKLK